MPFVFDADAPSTPFFGKSTSFAFSAIGAPTSFADIASKPSVFGAGFGSVNAPIDVAPVTCATPFAPTTPRIEPTTPKIKVEEPSPELTARPSDILAAPRRCSGRLAQSALRRSNRIKVKKEATRYQPGRTYKVKKEGFYAESNLAKLVMGSGSIKDPYVVY